MWFDDIGNELRWKEIDLIKGDYLEVNTYGWLFEGRLLMVLLFKERIVGLWPKILYWPYYIKPVKIFGWSLKNDI